MSAISIPRKKILATLGEHGESVGKVLTSGRKCGHNIYMETTPTTTTTHSSLYTGHRRTTVTVDGKVVGWVDRFPGTRTWSATAQTSRGTVERGDWHTTKRDAIAEIINYTGSGR
jgi:hypothetical protein